MKLDEALAVLKYVYVAAATKTEHSAYWAAWQIVERAAKKAVRENKQIVERAAKKAVKENKQKKPAKEK